MSKPGIKNLIIKIYFLQGDGDSEKSPILLVVGMLKAVVVMICFREIYDIFVGITSNFLDSILSAMPVKTVSLSEILTGNIMGGIFTAVACLVLLISWLILICQFIMKGIEMLLMRMGIAFASIVGVSLGVISAVKQYSPLDYCVRVTAMVMAAIPVFWLGMMLAILFALKLHWLPASGIGSWKHYVLPMLTLGIPYSARILRSTRSYMLEAIRQDYIRTARSKGIPEKRVIWKHAFINACLPIINTIGVYIGSLLGGAVVTETVFGCNGLGSFIINSVKRKSI